MTTFTEHQLQETNTKVQAYYKANDLDFFIKAFKVDINRCEVLVSTESGPVRIEAYQEDDSGIIALTNLLQGTSHNIEQILRFTSQTILGDVTSFFFKNTLFPLVIKTQLGLTANGQNTQHLITRQPDNSIFIESHATVHTIKAEGFEFSAMSDAQDIEFRIAIVINGDGFEVTHAAIPDMENYFFTTTVTNQKIKLTEFAELPLREQSRLLYQEPEDIVGGRALLAFKKALNASSSRRQSSPHARFVHFIISIVFSILTIFIYPLVKIFHAIVSIFINNPSSGKPPMQQPDVISPVAAPDIFNLEIQSTPRAVQPVQTPVKSALSTGPRSEEKPSRKVHFPKEIEIQDQPITECRISPSA